MRLLKEMYDKSKIMPQKIAFPEAHNEKIMQAAYETTIEGCIIPYFVGDVEKLKNLCEERGYDSSLFNFVDYTNEELINNYIEKYLKLPNALLKEKGLRRRLADPLYFSMVMQAVGDVDVSFAGIDYTTEEVLLAGQTIIGLKDNISTISSVGICEIPNYEGCEGNVLVIGDSAVCVNPDANQLADIAISACDTVNQLLGWEPRCALISYSTEGSGQGPLVDKVLEAKNIAKIKRPDLLIDGEFQLDAALIPLIAKKKVKKESKVAGRSNILIWPDLNVGNVAVKILQLFANSDAYGPLLQGFKKVVCDCSRSAPVSELKGNIVMSSVRSQNYV